METELSDAELAVRIGRGSDAAAEAEFCHRMRSRVRLYGLRHTRDEHLADDLAQQVLVTTLQALRAGRLREPDKLASFVLGTCRMTLLDLRRGAQRAERVLGQVAATISDAAPPPPLPEVDRDGLERCVQRLGERERTVIVMSFYDERTGADLASTLGLTEANVRVIRHRAIKQLRQCMGEAA